MGQITEKMYVDSVAMAATMGAKFVLDTINQLSLEASATSDDPGYEVVAEFLSELRIGIEKGIPLLEAEVRRTSPPMYKLLKTIG